MLCSDAAHSPPATSANPTTVGTDLAYPTLLVEGPARLEAVLALALRAPSSRLAVAEDMLLALCMAVMCIEDQSTLALSEWWMTDAGPGLRRRCRLRSCTCVVAFYSSQQLMYRPTACRHSPHPPP